MAVPVLQGDVPTMIPSALAGLPVAVAEELACKAHLGVWTARRRHLEMSPLHWEWCELRMAGKREAVCAPREHSKSETFTINGTAWDSIYRPGVWTYVFCDTGDQGREMLDRIKVAVSQDAPWMVEGAISDSSTDITFANWSRVTTAGAGKGVRGAHPDVIIGDDVLTEGNTLTAYQRRKTERWWFGTIGGMSHPGSWRALGKGEDAHRVWMPPTRVFLVGTPFHQQDLLMSMRENPLYDFRRYAAEFEVEDLVPGCLAVEVS